MKNLVLKLAICILCAWSVSGQTLQVSSASGSLGESVTVEISLRSPTGREPVVLKWETVFPVQILELEAGSPVAGSAAKTAGKTITCTAPKPYSRICVLTGGKDSVADGTIAVYRFKILAKVSAGTTTIRIQRIESLTGNLSKVNLVDATGPITIR